MSELTLAKHLRQFRYFVVEFSAQGRNSRKENRT